jgi:uncharacterized membrane protein HdeD (DUF308 family)
MDPTVPNRPSERVDTSRPAASSIWGGAFVSGLLISILGLMAFWTPVVSGVASAVVIGVLLAIAGAVELVGAFRNRREHSVVLPVLSGILSLVVGALFVIRPLVGVAAIALLVAAYFFATGLFRGVTSIADRYPRWGWDFAYGLIAVAAGAIVLLAWPLTSLLIVGMLVGIELLSRGVALMAISWKVRSLIGHDRHTHAPASV